MNVVSLVLPHAGVDVEMLVLMNALTLVQDVVANVSLLVKLSAKTAQDILV